MNQDVGLGPLGQVSRNVSDVAAAAAWYRDVLGLKHLFTFPSPVGDLAFFDCGGTRLFLSKPEDGAPVPAVQGVLYFRVADINASHAALAGRGVEFVDQPHMIFRHADGTEEWLSMLKDPEGRPLGIMAQAKP